MNNEYYVNNSAELLNKDAPSEEQWNLLYLLSKSSHSGTILLVLNINLALSLNFINIVGFFLEKDNVFLYLSSL